MLGIDTNILVRYLTGDDAAQSTVASEILNVRCTFENPGYISVIVMVELYWTLRRVFRLTQPEIIEAFQQLLQANELVFQNHEEVAYACRICVKAGSDFADVLLGAIAKKEGCTTTLTFDKAASKLDDFTLAI